MDFTNLLASLDCPICLQPLRKREKSISPESASSGRESKELPESAKKRNDHNSNTNCSSSSSSINNCCTSTDKSTRYRCHTSNDVEGRLVENANTTSSFEIRWASDLVEQHHQLLETCDAESNGSEEDDGIALLVCGHLLHYSCALQMYEYQVNNHVGYNREICTCPVCRSSLSGMEDIIPFHPCQRADRTRTHHMNALCNSVSTLHERESDEHVLAENSTLHAQENKHESTATTITVESQTESDDTEESKKNVNNNVATLPKKINKITKRQRCEETSDFSENNEEEAAIKRVALEDVKIINSIKSDKTASDDTNHNEDLEENEYCVHSSDNKDAIYKNDNDKSDTEEEDDSEITLIGTRQRPYTEVYLEQLNRKSALITSRNAVLHDRERHLSHSLKELEEECNELNDSITAARLRAEILRKHGLTQTKGVECSANVSSNTQNDCVECNYHPDTNEINNIEINAHKQSALDENKLRESAHCFSPLVPSESELRKRKKFLRQMCMDTQKASQTATLQLANVLSESAHVRRQVDKYTYKLNKLSALLHHTRNITDCN